MSTPLDRLMPGSNETHCHRGDHDLYREVLRSRMKAHEKHGANSIESIDPQDPRWLSTLGEEFGEICRALTYDNDGKNDLRAELIDVLVVASAWVSAIDQIAPTVAP